MVVLYRGVGTTQIDLSVRELFRIGVPLGLTDLVSRLGNRFDKLIVFVLFANATFAEFAVGAQIPIIGVIAGSVAAVYLPHFVGLFKKGESEFLIKVWRQTIVKTSLLVLPVAMIFIVAAEEAAVVLFTSEYEQTAVVFRLYAIYHLGRVASFGSILVAAGKPGYILQGALVFLVGNIIISIPAALFFGFWGPALGTIVAWVIAACFYSWRIAKATGVPLGRLFPMVEYLKTLFVTCAAGAMALAFKLSTDLPDSWSLAIQIVIVLSGFAILGTLTGRITRDDWAFLGNWMMPSRNNVQKSDNDSR